VERFFQNCQALLVHKSARGLGRIGNDVIKGLWDMTADEANAYYSSEMNKIVIPGGILSPPFFDGRLPTAFNFGTSPVLLRNSRLIVAHAGSGAIGSVIGHEITHGFDDQGRKYNSVGAYQNWWTNASASAFEVKAACFVNYFSALGENGKNTLGENLADSGGTHNSFETYKNQRSVYTIAGTGVQVPLTDDQLFFVAFAQLWCEKMTEQAAEHQLMTDPHSLAWLRVRGTLSNHPHFAESFGCPKGANMNPETKCSVW
jgi:predicted metalloendopeptidase